jgi:dinuclear metal center YbgI/SA1388 family protein
MAMVLQQVIAALEALAPCHLAESWDNVGLIVGDPGQDVSRAMLCIDYTPQVAAEAGEQRCGLVVAYHPPIFRPIKHLVAGEVVFDAIRRGIALYSPHTALDVADGGTNDVLADALGLEAGSRCPLRPATATARDVKLVTFVPEKDVDRVSQALFDAGAGRIGDYSSCSFRTPGTGTFLGGASTSPAVGQAGRLEVVAEVRLETVVPLSRISDVVRALRSAHPYEESAFDLVQLAAPPSGLGMGRIGEYASPVDRQVLFERIRQALGVSRMLVAGPQDGAVSRAAVCAGSCGDLLDDAIRQQAGLYLTGEMRHHDALRAAAVGMTVVCVLHSNSERAVLRRLAERLERACPELSVMVSRRDRDPFSVL